MLRHLSPYEKNQLLKYGLSLELADTDQTPVEYLTGHVDFCGRDFLITPDTLIPRLETQELVDLALKIATPPGWPDGLPGGGIHICDVGTGSGALGISLSLALLAQNIPHHLFLSDLSPKALAIAELNAQRLLPPDHQPILIQSNLLTGLPEKKFDLLTANLPYIPTNRISTLDQSVRDYEPHLALDGGPTGAEVINRLLQQLPHHLNSGGHALLEIDHTHTLASFAIPLGFKAEILPDSFGQTRFLRLARL